MMKLKKVLILILITAITLSLLGNEVSAAKVKVSVLSSQYKVLVNNKAYSIGTHKILSSNGRTFLPLDILTKIMGATCVEDTKNGFIKLLRGDKEIRFKIDSPNISINNVNSIMDKGKTQVLTYNKITYLPIAFVVNNLYGNVVMKGKNILITVKTLQQNPQSNDSIDEKMLAKTTLTEEDLKRLREYKDNVGSKVGQDTKTDYYYPNNKILDCLRTYNPNYGEEKILSLMDEAKKIAEILNTVDYRKSDDEIKNQYYPYLNPMHAKRFLENEVIPAVKNTKSRSVGLFLTDKSLVYQANDAGIRVRGVIRYKIYESNDCEKWFGKGTKVGKWMEEDCEVKLVTNYSKAEVYHYNGIFYISPSIRFLD